jgi:hypothetical protein
MFTGTADEVDEAGVLAADEAVAEAAVLAEAVEPEPEEQAARPTTAVAARAMDAVIFSDEVMVEG